MLTTIFASFSGSVVLPWHIGLGDMADAWPFTTHRQITNNRRLLTIYGGTMKGAGITIKEARELADQWKAQRDDREPRASYYADATPHDLIRMWETRKGKDGRKLNDWEFGCLVEAWYACFGDVPTDALDTRKAAHEKAEPVSLPADDTMLRMPDVERLTGPERVHDQAHGGGWAFPEATQDQCSRHRLARLRRPSAHRHAE